MAEGVLFDAVVRVSEALGSGVFQEIELAWGAKEEIRKLKDTVETIKAVLLDAEEQHSRKNHQVTLWLRRLKDAVYDADDLLDDFATQLKQRELMSTATKMAKEVRIFFSKSRQIAYSLKMGHKLKTIRERLDNIKNDRKFHLDEKALNDIGREETHSFVRAEEIIGRDDDKNAVIQLLFDSNDTENVSVIPIVGMGGLGKTALAQLIYNDEKVINHFKLRMWVCVSKDFNVKVIVKQIIKSANHKIDVEILEMDGLQENLRQEINGKEYLLVLDDIWNENLDAWLRLKTLLINDTRGSKILVTSRSEQVAAVTSKLPFMF